METKRQTATGEGEMMNAREKMTTKITTLKDNMILEMLTVMDGTWDDATPDQRVLRSELLNEWEKRHGGNSVDVVMDSLEACKTSYSH